MLSRIYAHEAISHSSNSPYAFCICQHKLPAGQRVSRCIIQMSHTSNLSDVMTIPGQKALVISFVTTKKNENNQTNTKKTDLYCIIPASQLVGELHRSPVQVTERIWWSSRCPTGCWSGSPGRAVAPPPAVCGWRTETCPGSAVADSQSQICPPGWPFCDRTEKRAIRLFACKTLKVTQSKSLTSWQMV